MKLRVMDRIYDPDVIVACGTAAEVELIVEEPSLVVQVAEHARDRSRDGEIAIPFLDLKITTAEIYEDVRLPPLVAKDGKEWEEEDRGELDGEEGRDRRAPASNVLDATSVEG